VCATQISLHNLIIIKAPNTNKMTDSTEPNTDMYTVIYAEWQENVTRIKNMSDMSEEEKQRRYIEEGHNKDTRLKNFNLIPIKGNLRNKITLLNLQNFNSPLEREEEILTEVFGPASKKAKSQVSHNDPIGEEPEDTDEMEDIRYAPKIIDLEKDDQPILPPKPSFKPSSKGLKKKETPRRSDEMESMEKLIEECAETDQEEQLIKQKIKNDQYSELVGKYNATEIVALLKQCQDTQEEISWNKSIAKSYFWLKLITLPEQFNMRKYLQEKNAMSRVDPEHCTTRYGEGFIACKTKSDQQFLKAKLMNVVEFVPVNMSMPVGERYGLYVKKDECTTEQIKQAMFRFTKNHNMSRVRVEEGKAVDSEKAYVYLRVDNRKDWEELYQVKYFQTEKSGFEVRLSLEKPTDPNLIRLSLKGWNKSMTEGALKEMIAKRFNVTKKKIVAIDCKEGWNTANVMVESPWTAFTLLKESLNRKNLKFEIPVKKVEDDE
jgi:hypothetical protein